MRTYDEVFAAALDKPAFSNGMEGDGWMGEWCERCVHDKGTRDGSNPVGCNLVMVALMERTPVEWLEQDHAGGYRLGDAYHCVEFRNEDDPGPGYEPPPPPEDPSQVDMFEVFADQIVEQIEQPVPMEAIR